MHQFKDTQGRAWQLSITAGSIKRVKGLVGVNIYDLVNDKFQGLDDLFRDVIQLVDVLYGLVAPQAQGLQVTDEQFGEAMAGDAIHDAAQAFLAELADFFPEDRMRKAIRRMMAKGKAYREKMIDWNEKQVEAVDPEKLAQEEIARLEAEQEKEKEKERLRAQRSKDSSGGSPGSAELIPPG